MVILKLGCNTEAFAWTRNHNLFDNSLISIFSMSLRLSIAPATGLGPTGHFGELHQGEELQERCVSAAKDTWQEMFWESTNSS